MDIKIAETWELINDRQKKIQPVNGCAGNQSISHNHMTFILSHVQSCSAISRRLKIISILVRYPRWKLLCRRATLKIPRFNSDDGKLIKIASRCEWDEKSPKVLVEWSEKQRREGEKKKLFIVCDDFTIFCWYFFLAFLHKRKRKKKKPEAEKEKRERRENPCYGVFEKNFSACT